MLKVCDQLSEMEIDFNEPIKVDFQGEGKDENKEWTSFYAVNDYVITSYQLKRLIEQKRDAIWHFGFDSLRIFMSEMESSTPERDAATARVVCDMND